MTSVSQSVLYSQNSFDTPNPTKEQLAAMLKVAATIGASGFTCMILGQWHVHADGTVYYNDTLLSKVIGHLPEVVAAIKASGTIQKVLITFGPFGSDFDHIATNLDTVKKDILQLKKAGIDGIDYDLEQEYSSSQSTALVDLTKWAKTQGLIVTAAPYQEQTFWSNLLKAVGKEGFAWWNLQLYGGAYYPTWVDALNGAVANPQSFLVPGWSAGRSSPANVQSALQSTKKSYSSLSGGFIWNLASAQKNGNTLTDYAKAINGSVT